MVINNCDDQRLEIEVRGCPSHLLGPWDIICSTLPIICIMYGYAKTCMTYEVIHRGNWSQKCSQIRFYRTEELLCMDVSKYCDCMTRCLENITADVWDSVARVKIQTRCFQTQCQCLFFCRWKYPPVWTHFVWKMTHGARSVISGALCAFITL